MQMWGKISFSTHHSNVDHEFFCSFKSCIENMYYPPHHQRRFTQNLNQFVIFDFDTYSESLSEIQYQKGQVTVYRDSD